MRNLGDTLVNHRYTATFIRRGYFRGKTTALLADITSENGTVLADHLWVTGGIWKQVQHTPGDIVSFEGTPYRYIKGYRKDSEMQVDIALADVHVFGVIGRNPNIQELLKKCFCRATIPDYINQMDTETYKKLVNSQYADAAKLKAERDARHEAERRHKKKERPRTRKNRF